MAVFSVEIVFPATYAVRTHPKTDHSLRMDVGLGTSALGSYVMVVNWTY